GRRVAADGRRARMKQCVRPDQNASHERGQAAAEDEPCGGTPDEPIDERRQRPRQPAVAPRWPLSVRRLLVRNHHAEASAPMPMTARARYRRRIRGVRCFFGFAKRTCTLRRCSVESSCCLSAALYLT